MSCISRSLLKVCDFRESNIEKFCYHLSLPDVSDIYVKKFMINFNTMHSNHSFLFCNIIFEGQIVDVSIIEMPDRQKMEYL